MARLEAVEFVVADGVELIVYSHDVGDEFWFHYFYTPVLFAGTVITKDVVLSDIQVSIVHCYMSQLVDGHQGVYYSTLHCWSRSPWRRSSP